MKSKIRRDRPSTKTEILIGRTLAACAHPFAAWRMSVEQRAMLLVTYSVAAYVVVLTALFALKTP